MSGNSQNRFSTGHRCQAATLTPGGAARHFGLGRGPVIIWRNAGWLGLYEMVPGFALASLAILIFSLLDSPPDSSITSAFAHMKEELHKPDAPPGNSMSAAE